VGASYQDIALRAGFTIEPLKRCCIRYVNRTSILFDHPVIPSRKRYPRPQSFPPHSYHPRSATSLQFISTAQSKTPPQSHPLPPHPPFHPLINAHAAHTHSQQALSPPSPHVTHSTTPAPPHSPPAALPFPVPEHRRQSTIYGPRSLCIRACPAPPQMGQGAERKPVPLQRWHRTSPAMQARQVFEGGGG
jgi:hypothetical protein